MALKGILFYILFPIIWGLSKLPLRVLYTLADFFYWIIYYVVKYRRIVVRNNLICSFPEYSIQKITNIEKKFYRFFCDFLVETIKYVSISEAELKCRITLRDTGLMADFFNQKQSVIGALGHCGNWEWASPYFSFMQLHRLNVIYHPLSNPYFEHFFVKVRSRFGANLVKMNDTARKMLAIQKDTVPHFSVFVADQTPSPDNAFWFDFLHQDTPFFRGVEILAKKCNMPVVYISIKRPKRGFYSISYELLSSQPTTEAEGAIMQKFVTRLEQDIIAQPEIWLWSHRRWKYKRNG